MLTRGNAQAVLRAIAGNGTRAVARIVEVSATGRAPRNDPALFAPALAASATDLASRRLALAALPQVARTGTHLFAFAGFVQGSASPTRTTPECWTWWASTPPPRR